MVVSGKKEFWTVSRDFAFFRLLFEAASLSLAVAPLSLQSKFLTTDDQVSSEHLVSRRYASVKAFIVLLPFQSNKQTTIT
jgi:hypothetical protein